MKALKQSRHDDAIAALRKHGPMRVTDFGWLLWGDTTEVPDRGEGSHRQNKFARSAGKLLRQLERDGRVSKRVHGSCHLWSVIEKPE
ncbi:hypothetical protein [Singulisphaera sp. PoT]|uniref:hypothetical protein n=1 Tax=Singulisphaera sp. PoT TaxID=3411797 RepID=UPI003BF5A9FA